VSSALAIGAVTAVLTDLLNNGLIDRNVSGALGGNVDLTVLPPDLMPTAGGAQDRDRLNLFLYHVMPNQGWRNVGLPSRDARGDRLSNPPLALDLHYLLTAYSKEPFHAEILLGYAMQLLHETPILTRNAIRTALGPPTPPLTGGILPAAFRSLLAADLAEQVEQIKICPMSMSTEEMSKLWTSFQTHYRTTAVYQVSVVLIESRQSTKSALPVLTRNIYVAPFQQPVIETIESSTGAKQPIGIGSTLVIRGTQLKADSTRIKIGALDIVVPPAGLSDKQISLALQTPTLSTAELNLLRAGVQAVQISHDLNLGTREKPSEKSLTDPHRGIESNVAAFVLQPTIDKNAGGNYIITPSGLITGADGNKSGTITVNLKPSVGKSQRVTLFLNAWSPPGATSPPLETYRFSAPSENGITVAAQTTTNAIPFSIRGVVPGRYLVRVQVDGAESPLDVDTTTNQFVGTPQVTI
jgi:Pvc16 N-terminal domain